MIRLLRISRPARLLTAEAYEELFVRNFGPAFAVEHAPLDAWCSAVLGPPGAPRTLPDAAAAFAEATRGVDFFCPNFECIPLAPLLVALRNRAGARVRLLFIAHAAGAYAMEWAMLRPLLAPGDVVVTPSESARRTVEFLCPELRPFLRVIPHPMEPLPRGPGPERERVVSLGRVHAHKLIHRQVEAMAELRARGRRLPEMLIAGPLDDGGWADRHPYTRTLEEKIRRLELDDHVRLVGAIRGREAKGRFLSSATLLVNLSVTLEESFPKAPVESLGVGVPVLGTQWNGLRDTVGPCGTLVPVDFVGGGVGRADVGAAAVADALEALLAERPAPEACLAHVEPFRPEHVVPRYRAMLEEAREAAGGPLPEPPAAGVGAAPDEGLLAVAAPLAGFSWSEAFDHYRDSCAALRTGWLGAAPGRSPGDRIRGLLQVAVQAPLERFAAGLPVDVPRRDPASPPPPRAGWVAAIAAAQASRPTSGPGVAAAAAATPGPLVGRLACVGDLMEAGRLDEAGGAMALLEREGRGEDLGVVGVGAELTAARGDVESALERCAAALRAAPAVEQEDQRVRQLARLARRLGRPERALDELDRWLARFPDGQESGAVALELCMTAWRAGREEDAARALARAELLLGPLPAVQKAARMLAARRAEALLG